MTINIKTALHQAQTYKDLLAIAEKLHADLCSWGYQYATVTAQSPLYQGTIATGAVAKKALKISLEMKKNKMGFTTDEADSVYPFCKKIYCLYVEDKSLCNQANRLTAIFRSVVRVIFWADHQPRWGDVWERSNKVMTYSDIICEGLPKSKGWGPLEGEITQAFIRRIMDWEDQGATYIPYPNGT